MARLLRYLSSGAGLATPIRPPAGAPIEAPFRPESSTEINRDEAAKTLRALQQGSTPAPTAEQVTNLEKAIESIPDDCEGNTTKSSLLEAIAAGKNDDGTISASTIHAELAKLDQSKIEALAKTFEQKEVSAAAAPQVAPEEAPKPRDEVVRTPDPAVSHVDALKTIERLNESKLIAAKAGVSEAVAEKSDGLYRELAEKAGDTDKNLFAARTTAYQNLEYINSGQKAAFDAAQSEYEDASRAAGTALVRRNSESGEWTVIPKENYDSIRKAYSDRLEELKKTPEGSRTAEQKAEISSLEARLAKLPESYEAILPALQKYQAAESFLSSPPLKGTTEEAKTAEVASLKAEIVKQQKPVADLARERDFQAALNAAVISLNQPGATVPTATAAFTNSFARLVGSASLEEEARARNLLIGLNNPSTYRSGLSSELEGAFGPAETLLHPERKAGEEGDRLKAVSGKISAIGTELGDIRGTGEPAVRPPPTSTRTDAPAQAAQLPGVDRSELDLDKPVDGFAVDGEAFKGIDQGSYGTLGSWSGNTVIVNPQKDEATVIAPATKDAPGEIYSVAKGDDGRWYRVAGKPSLPVNEGDSKTIVLESAKGEDGISVPTKVLKVNNDKGVSSLDLFRVAPGGVPGVVSYGLDGSVLKDRGIRVDNSMKEIGKAFADGEGIYTFSGGGLWLQDGKNTSHVLGSTRSALATMSGGGVPGLGSPMENTGFNTDYLLAGAQAMRQKMWNDLKKTQRERLLEMLIAAMAGGACGPVSGIGMGPGQFGDGFAGQFGFGSGPGGWGANMGIGVGNGDSAFGVGLGVGSGGAFGVNLGFANQNFGFNLSFSKGMGGGFHPGLGICGCSVDFETLLLMIMAVLEEEEREKIAVTIKKMRDLSKEQKGITKEFATEKPNYAAGLSTDSAILQTELTMSVQNRQRLIETVNNAIRSAHEAKQNSIRRIV